MQGLNHGLKKKITTQEPNRFEEIKQNTKTRPNI